MDYICVIYYLFLFCQFCSTFLLEINLRKGGYIHSDGREKQSHKVSYVSLRSTVDITTIYGTTIKINNFLRLFGGLLQK